MSTQVLQRLIFNPPVVGAGDVLPTSLYSDNDLLVASSACNLFLPQGKTVSFDRYVNRLNLEQWGAFGPLSGLTLDLHLSGQAVARIYHHRAHQPPRLVSEHPLAHTVTHHCLSITDDLVQEERPEGWLSVSLEALADSWVTGGWFSAAATARPPIQLGVVVTHFNRVEQTQAFTSYLIAELLDDPAYDITLTVVDNSNNLALPRHPAVTLVPNQNLGGSGGFMRGLLGAEQAGLSHVLFMDDDAVCDAEAIRRTYTALQRAQDPAAAIAGTLSLRHAPEYVHEQGGQFSHRVVSLRQNQELNRLEELPSESIEYGAWWFFAFPVAAVRRYAFPFFVRGDDILFGLQNQFSIHALNGVFSLSDSFAQKSSPMTRYLDTRSHILVNLSKRRADWPALGALVGRLFLGSALSYHYAAARAVILAIDHVAQGPRFFADHMDMRVVRQDFKRLGIEREQSALTARSVVEPRPNARPSPITSIKTIVSNGGLVPRFLLQRGAVRQSRLSPPQLSDIAGYEAICYHDPLTGDGYTLERCPREFWRLSAQFMGAAIRLAVSLPRLRREYRAAFSAMTSREFWQEVYANELAQPPSPPRPPTDR